MDGIRRLLLDPRTQLAILLDRFCRFIFHMTAQRPQGSSRSLNPTEVTVIPFEGTLVHYKKCPICHPAQVVQEKAGKKPPRNRSLEIRSIFSYSYSSPGFPRQAAEVGCLNVLTNKQGPPNRISACHDPSERTVEDSSADIPPLWCSQRYIRHRALRCQILFQYLNALDFPDLGNTSKNAFPGPAGKWAQEGLMIRTINSCT